MNPKKHLTNQFYSGSTLFARGLVTKKQYRFSSSIVIVAITLLIQVIAVGNVLGSDVSITPALTEEGFDRNDRDITLKKEPILLPREEQVMPEVYITSSSWSPLQPIDLSSISIESIGDWLVDRPVSQGVEQDINYYIAHFHRIANAVKSSDPNKGFIDIQVWRNPVDNEPYNARIMESITTLAWFYTSDPEWNPYYGDEDLRKILEASLTFWLNIQHADGRFSEYGENRWNLAATAFATKFMGKTLELLQDGPEIDSALHEQVKLANRKALMVVFTNESFYDLGIRFSNQFGNAFTGALAHLSMNPEDIELKQVFESRLQTSLDDFQSPVGFYYEWYGPDWGYAFGTHHSNILMAWHYARHDADFAAHYAKEHERFTEWLSYNAVQQPGDDVFVLHSSIQSRQSRTTLARLESPLSEVVPMARAFNVTSEEAEERLTAVRQRVTSNWLNIPSLQTGSFAGYSAYSFLHRDHYRWNPDNAQREAAIATLPYLASDDFIHQRVDNLTHFETTYIRKVEYYAAFSAGEQQTDQQRFGLGLLWSPDAGALFQSQSRSNDAAWGTMTISNRVASPWEAFPMDATYRLDGAIVEPEVGAHELGGKQLEISYPLGSTGILSGIGSKNILFDDDNITVEITHNGPFKEILPLLVRNPLELRIDEERGIIQVFQLGRFGYEKLRIVINNPESITSITSLNPRSIGAEMSVIPVHITTSGALEYSITITPKEPLSTPSQGLLHTDSPAEIQLHRNYPNPFNSSTNVVFNLNSGSDVQLKLYNTAGEVVMTQQLGFHNAGRHTVLVRADELASGVYFIQMEASGHSRAIPITLLK